MIELPFDGPNMMDKANKNYTHYLESDDFKELIGVKPMAHKEQKQMLIDAIKVKHEEAYSKYLEAKKTMKLEYYYFDGKSDGIEECLDLIEGIL